MSETLYELSITVFGRVQGVGFRYYTQDVAKRLQVAGWARNTYDGKVEILCYGRKSTLEQFLTYVKKGPQFSLVRNINTGWNPIQELPMSDFSIKF